MLPFLFALPCPATGQYSFLHVSEAQGLSSLQIIDLFQDRFGFVWVATPHGLNRFDGYGCVQYFSQPGDSTSLASNHISPRAFAEDATGNLWVATYRGGLHYFDRKTERFTRYRAQPGRPGSLSMDKLFAVEPGAGGGLWIATAGRGINYFDPHTRSFRARAADLLLHSTMTGCLKVDKTGRLWVGTNKGVCRFEPRTETFEYFPFAGGQERSLSNGFVTAIHEDRQGNIWVGTAQGLNRWDAAQGVFVKYFFARSLPGNEPGHDYIHDLLADDDGWLWLATNAGLLRFRPADGSLERVQHVPDNPFSIRKGPVNTILKDREGNLWFGTNDGISILNNAGRQLNHERFFPVQQAFKSIAQTEGINAVQEVNGNFWVATQLGLYHVPSGEVPQPIFKGNFSALFFDRERAEVYAGTTGNGFYVFDAGNKTLLRHVRKSEPGNSADPRTVKGNRLTAFAKDVQGYLWIAADGSLNRYDPASGRLRKFHDTDKNLPNPSSNTNYHLLTDRDGNLWIASMGGLSRLSRAELARPFDEPVLRFEHFLHRPGAGSSISSDVVFCLLESADGALWAGTDAGLNRYDPRSGTWQWFFKKDGLPGDEIVVLAEDRNGALWVGSANEGLAKLDRPSGHFFRFSKKDGLHTDRFRPNAGLCSAEGFVVLGGRTGLTGFHPDSLRNRAAHPPPLYFTGFEIFNRPVPIGPGHSELRAPIYQTDRIDVAYEQNVLSFQFAALNFVHPEKQLYRYRLSPFHRDWQYNGEKRDATFTNLAPGTYQLRVETSDNGYDWSGKTLTLHVHPPWYRTWWAWLLFTFAAAMLLDALRRFELRRQLAKAEARRLQELDLAKNRLYTNITHEFRTPLTVILGMEEQLRKDPVNWLDEGLRLIRRNGNQLLHLVSQLLDLAKLESGHLPLRPVQADVVRYLHYLTEAFHSYADSKDIRLHFRSDFTELYMDYDPEKLQNVVSNLVSNAVKFTPAGGDVYVDLRSAHFSGESPGSTPAEILIQVSDTGPGIAPEHLPHVFDRFYQIDTEDPALVRRNEGSGVGLAIVQELVRLMGGSIAAESPGHTGGRGARFSIRLPVTRSAPQAKVESVPAANEDFTETPVSGRADTSPVPVERHSILLVEDNADVIAYLVSVLSLHYHIVTARNGQEGLDKAFELVPDVVVSDVMMPGKGGFELCRELKTDERTSHIPVVLLTARADQASRLEGLSHGADVYLEKPFHQEELLVRLEKLIELRRHLQERFRQTGGVQRMLEEPAGSMDDQFLQKIAQQVEAHLADETFGMPELCKALHMSRSNLFRKLKALTGQSVTAFIRTQRLEKARELLETTDLSVTEACFAVGFSSPNYFSRMFQETFGTPPREWRKG